MRPYAGWQQLSSAADWVRPSRQMAGTPYWYLHTDQWRYESYAADALASPTGRGTFAGRHTADLVAQSARLGWMPSYPTFSANPLDLGRRVHESGQEPGGLGGRVNSPPDSWTSPVEDPDAPAQLAARPHRVAGQPHRILRQGQRVLPAPSAGRAGRRERPAGAARTAAERRHLARRGAARQARPAAEPRLPDDLHHTVLGPRPARRHLVREARPLQHGHAPLRARLQPRRSVRPGRPVPTSRSSTASPAR